MRCHTCLAGSRPIVLAASVLLFPSLLWAKGRDARASTGQPSAYACDQLLPDSARLLLALLDPWTGLPYDQLPCGPWASGPLAVNRAFGVVPQLAYASITRFAQEPAHIDDVHFEFVDQGPAQIAPAVLFALKVDMHLTPENVFGGVVWGAGTDVRRYHRLRLRYATSAPSVAWQLKLNFGAGPAVEPAVDLPGTSGWSDLVFELPGDFAGGDMQRLNYITLATDMARAGADPVLWIDQLVFEPDPSQIARCDDFCTVLPAYPDLACYESVFTGAVNIANALTALSVLPQGGLAPHPVAQLKVGQILATLEKTPGRPSDGKWMQDWHSAASGMPDQRNRVGSTTDLPQLYAALMVVEERWPAFAARARALRARLDFSLLPEPGNTCCVRWAVDRCAGVLSGCLEYIGRDTLLGSFLAVASGAAPMCHWQSLATIGCAHDGPASDPWFTTGPPCNANPIPATGVGGPFLQLAAPLYLDESRIPWGPLSLGRSAGNMLRAQARFAEDNELDLAGWANASDPDACSYMTCDVLTTSKVTPYVWAMGADLVPSLSAQYLQAFHDAGADAPLSTGSVSHAFGLRDAWNQTSGSARDAYLYLDSGWSVLGLLNSCRPELVKRSFGKHSVAKNGYRLLGQSPPLCPTTP